VFNEVLRTKERCVFCVSSNINNIVHIAVVIIIVNNTIIILYRKYQKCALNFLAGERARKMVFSDL